MPTHWTGQPGRTQHLRTPNFGGLAPHAGHGDAGVVADAFPPEFRRVADEIDTLIGGVTVARVDDSTPAEKTGTEAGGSSAAATPGRSDNEQPDGEGPGV